MNVNLEIYGIIIVAFYGVTVTTCMVLGFVLGKQKTNTPLISAICAGVISLMPLMGFVYIALLTLKNDVARANA